MIYNDRELKNIHKFWDNFYLKKCSICKGSGMINNQLCSCVKQANAAYQCEVNGFGRKYLQLSLIDNHLKQSVNNYFSDFQKYLEQGIGLYIFGKYGSGKTLAVTNLAKNIVMIENPLQTKSFLVKFFLYDDLVRFALEANSFLSLEEIIKKPDILILDNLGKETGLKTAAKFSVSLLENILRNREMSGKITWITTNLNKNDFSNEYNEALAKILERNFKLICSN